VQMLEVVMKQWTYELPDGGTAPSCHSLPSGQLQQPLFCLQVLISGVCRVCRVCVVSNQVSASPSIERFTMWRWK
jgi:hypothetical protein